ncbi:hypothetical protein J6590_057423 [Homalodisca vitripennis]|nr:hypothetical protein J6590_057423 [Homalodisca vitripennis]
MYRLFPFSVFATEVDSLRGTVPCAHLQLYHYLNGCSKYHEHGSKLPKTMVRSDVATRVTTVGQSP